MIHIVQQSCLEKIRTDARHFSPAYTSASALLREEFSFQIALYSDRERPEKVYFRHESSLPTCIYMVKQVAVSWPHYRNDPDLNYLLDEPGLLPDCLIPMDETRCFILNDRVTVLWIAVKAIFAGHHQIRFRFYCDGDEQETCFHLQVLPHPLPRQWFTVCTQIHSDCILSSRKIPVFSNLHWELLEKYFSFAAMHGTTDLLTPLFSLNQPDRLEQNTVQLIDLSVEGERYSFDFDRFDSWIMLARKNGIDDFTFPAIFPSLETQRCPLIMARVNRRYRPLFDQDTDILSPEYIAFIRQFLRAFTKHLNECGLEGHVRFQLTGKASVKYAPVYKKCREAVSDLLKRFRIIDVFSDDAFYHLGLAAAPVMPLRSMRPFLNEHTAGMTGCLDIHFSDEIGNQLIAAPSVRLRAAGLLFYRYDIIGFMNREFNCYRSLGAGGYFNPYLNTEGENAYPSGSQFLVYPGAEGPIPSIRLKQFLYALQDLRAMELLERFMPREKIIAMIDREVPVSTVSYPQDPASLLAFREKINQLLMKCDPDRSDKNSLSISEVVK